MEHETGWMTLGDEDRRRIAGWAADCAERVLPLFEAAAPADARPREAIAGARAYAAGGPRTAHLRTLVWAAYAAAREVGDPAAAAAARAAGVAAGVAYTHERVNANQVKHVLGPAVYAARARELAAGEEGAGEEELRWVTRNAPADVCGVVRRMPGCVVERGRLGALFSLLDAGLRR